MKEEIMDFLQLTKVKNNSLFILMIGFLLYGCSNPPVTNTSLKVNDSAIQLFIPKEFNQSEDNANMSEWVAHVASSYFYKGDNNSLLSINYEIPYSGQRYFYNELGRDDKIYNDKKLLMKNILELAIGNANSAGANTWNIKEITELGGKKCIYVDYEARNKRNINIIWFTDSLYFIEFYYQSPIDNEYSQIENIIESIKITKN